MAAPFALIVAAFAFCEFQVTAVVRFRVELSLYVPVAMNVSVVPTETMGFAGVTAIDLRIGSTEGTL